jgi:ABC-type antimicrobial peptide transport system permease subunit
MKPGTNIHEFNNDLINRVKQSDPNTNISCVLYPFKDLYLKLWGGLGGIILFSTIATLILFIACINYINLSTAKSVQRFKEVALKKVAGAQRSQLVSQFIGESILLALISLLISMIAVELLLPYFNSLINKPIFIDYSDNVPYFFLLLGIVILVGILAGLYPSIQISTVKPIIVTGSHTGKLRGRNNFRQGLVIFQFSLSIILIISTIFIFKQLHYLQVKELGLDKDHLVYLPLEGKIKENPYQFRDEILKNADFGSATLTSGLPTGIYWNAEGWNWPGKDPGVDPLVTILCADHHFLETFQIPLKAGRFLNENPGDNVVINEAFAEIISEESVIGTTLWHGGDREIQHTIMGVIQNFHFKPLYHEIEPIVIFKEGKFARFNFLIIRLQNPDIQESIAYLKKIYKTYNPNFPFDVHFLDDDYDRQYAGFKRVNTLVGIFALLSILISCLGLFGLSSFLTIRRTKEIGIRKVNGAYTYQITLMLSKYFIKYVAIGFLIAIPISLLIVRSWLTNFAFKTSIAWWVFALTGLFTVVIAVLTVSYQSIKAALKNPVDSLRYE